MQGALWSSSMAAEDGSPVGGVGFAVGVRGGCPPHAYKRPQVALHDRYVNEKDRQELADTAL